MEVVGGYFSPLWGEFSLSGGYVSARGPFLKGAPALGVFPRAFCGPVCVGFRKIVWIERG